MSSFNFFANITKQLPDFFDEGPGTPIAVQTLGSTSGSIDTSAIDPFRQGVELTQLKHFDAGSVKISAGEPGHILRRNRFGMDRLYDLQPAFQDIDYFNPITFIEAQSASSPIDVSLITFPIITSDVNEIENYVMDGIIEPLTIRSRASFFSTDVPFEAHEVNGSLMGANLDVTKASDQILTVDYYDVNRKQLPFLDLIADIGDPIHSVTMIPNAGYYSNAKSNLAPWADAKYSRDVVNSSRDITGGASMDKALSLMSGTVGYIPFSKRSSACGWDFDGNVTVGTDSIAFGGFGH